jgi:hypothetical protein
MFKKVIIDDANSFVVRQWALLLRNAPVGGQPFKVAGRRFGTCNQPTTAPRPSGLLPDCPAIPSPYSPTFT